MATLNLSEDRSTRLRKPWEVLDQEILPELTVEEVFGKLKKLSRDGAYLKSSCPLHNGPEPNSFSIDPDRLEWICFAGCGAGGPIQFLQAKREQDWMEAARALAVMAGVDTDRLKAWGQHWTDEDYKQHRRLENRSSLLRIFMAMARSLFESEAGKSIRSSLTDQFGADEEQFQSLDLGLYGTPTDVYHILKSSHLDLAELRAAGFFEASWQGRVVATWEDLSGRIVNLWSWPSSGIRSDGPAPRGDILFERDSLGSQKTPFLLTGALAAGVLDLVHFDDPVHAIGARLAGLKYPFPVASQGKLVAEQMDVLEGALAGGGSFTLLPSYEPKKKQRPSRALGRDEKLLGKAPFPTYLIDPLLMARNRAEPMGPEQFIRQNGLQVFSELLEQSEALASPEETSGGWGLGKVFGGLSAKRTPKAGAGPSAGNLSMEQLPALLGMIMNAAEEIGSRLAQGFLKALPGHSLSVPPTGSVRQLSEETAQGELPSGSEGAVRTTSLAATTGPTAMLPPAPEVPPLPFSVDRLERQSLGSALVKVTGWSAVDQMEVRFRPGELTIVGGESGHGRTSFLVGILLHWLFTTREEFVYYSLDESEAQIYHRLLSLVTAAGGIAWPLTRVRNHFSSRKNQGPDPETQEFDSLATSREFLRNWESRFRLVYRPTTQPGRILAELEPLARDGNVGGIFIDSLDGLQGDSESPLSLGAQLKTLAVKLNCPVIVSSRTTQLTQKRKLVAQEISHLLAADPEGWERLLEKLEACRPSVDEFAPEIEKESDMLMGLLNCASLYPSPADLPPRTLFEVGLIKNRSGPSGEWVLLALERQFCRLADVVQE